MQFIDADLYTARIVYSRIIFMKRVLVTGAAGFIGFHLARALKKRGDFVLGLDVFNAYYDPKLKRKRAQILSQENVEVVEGDVQNTELLKELSARHQFTHVAHLAAQAGVRHSILKPEEYVAANLHGFTSVLEVCRAFAGTALIYASSSSVYGLNEKIPFSTEDRTDLPANFYGATKKANEVMAHAYHHLFGIPVTGLRYFTVYGPWGRPDMAYYRFCQLLSEGRPIPLFHGGKMRRDFTYIDDIVEGTLAAIDLSAPCEIFNLGSHHPVEIRYLVERLEKELGCKAVCESLPMQPGEVLETYADIRKSEEKLGFSPRVSIEEGLHRFVDWFRNYN
jgi:UDP-glucuronate 4-epimerase